MTLTAGKMYCSSNVIHRDTLPFSQATFLDISPKGLPPPLRFPLLQYLAGTILELAESSGLMEPLSA